MRIRGELSRFITPIVLLLMISLLLLPGGKDGLEKIRELKQGKKQPAAEKAAEPPTAQELAPNFIGLSDADKRRLNFGAHPERRILQALAEETVLLEEVAGKNTTAKWLLDESLVLNNHWLLATFIANQHARQALIQFQIKGTGTEAKFTWHLLAD